MMFSIKRLRKNAFSAPTPRSPGAVPAPAKKRILCVGCFSLCLSRGCPGKLMIVLAYKRQRQERRCAHRQPYPLEPRAAAHRLHTEETPPFSTFPMFVPSLSWQNDNIFSLQWLPQVPQKRRRVLFAYNTATRSTSRRVPPAQNGTLFLSGLPMFVPSLSW